MNIFLIKNNKAKSTMAFTVLEAIIALSVISLAIAGVFSAVKTSLNASMASKDKITAFYLAQEAVEILREKRDNNRFLGTGINWLYQMAALPSDPCYHGKTCTIDGYQNLLVSCPGGWGSCPALNQNGVSFIYSYISDGNQQWRASKYKREIQIECVGGAGACSSTNEVWVTVSVKWSQGVVSYDLKAKTLLFNWK